LKALAAQAHDDNLHRQDEPYRNALVGIYARLAATARLLSGYMPPRPPSVAGLPYETSVAFRADLDTIAPRSQRTVERRSPPGGSIR
jgi:phosphoenolpyruvate carboxylase